MMPNQNEQFRQQNNKIPSDFLKSIRAIQQNPTSESDLVYEISELRKEIAQLRADLLPVPTLILTGKSVLDEFKRLNGASNHD